MWNWKWLGISGVWTIPYRFCPYVGRTQTWFYWKPHIVLHAHQYLCFMLEYVIEFSYYSGGFFFWQHIIVGWIMEELWQGLEYAYASTSGLSVDIWHNVTFHMACRRTWTVSQWHGWRAQQVSSELDRLVFHSLLLSFCYTWWCSQRWRVSQVQDACVWPMLFLCICA